MNTKAQKGNYVFAAHLDDEYKRFVVKLFEHYFILLIFGLSSYHFLSIDQSDYNSVCIFSNTHFPYFIAQE